MFSLLESKQEIARAQRKLSATIRREFPRNAVANIGYPGGTEVDAEIRHNQKYWYWTANYKDSDVPNPRCRNWFGLYNGDSNLQITVEINTAYENPRKQVAGFFARHDRTGAVYLFHSGRVAGGTTGVGRTAFLAWSGEQLVDVVSSTGDIREAVLVMPIDGTKATRPIIRYINQIADFKRAVRNGEIDTPAFKDKQKKLEDFYAEARGRRKGRRSGQIDYLSRHGEVVDALYEWRKATPLAKGAKIVKNVLIDMGVRLAGTLTELFEVKTSTDRPDVYTALGQLVVHGRNNGCQRVIVLPAGEKLHDDFRAAMQSLNIRLLRFRMDEEEVQIISTD